MPQLKSAYRNSPIVITKTMIWFLVFGYGLFLVGTSTYENYRLNKDIEEAKQKITTLERDKRNLELALLYYKSNAFKETESRLRLGLKGKDEKVVALPEANTEPMLAIASSRPETYIAEKTTPPHVSWWNLFFGS